MGFYNLHAAAIPRLVEHGRGLELASDAANLASVIRHLRAEAPATLRRIEE